MAIKRQKGSSLTLYFDAGLDEKGKTIIKTKRISYLDLAVTEEACFTIANALATLTVRPLLETRKTEEYIILEEI
ncbi:DUF1659 domain-containing protein [Mangrovibacillus cuniculi]|uniref:DUF1659 domain-containing protein n=1 Tax=Mangrovibacillus cuniculi TaxID=2593652 RepID=A0A7S8CAU2_9BACI|nr:DUF1659 domain-containing protein [Mangrovibacillus cuniculi]QPC46451.1 DUF1659 domain-containing protein [Mangrovibacillus cuniculi]